ncbi:hypothetical protein CCZ01_02930 [Helicobacter monodelphidis]|uniref:ArsA family ATPase n=1 Tax=Helicobacter sp. 15-1451 TaxID=2004995 RepID=UPI000DCC59AB|nr:ArsA family ATPase [Helicobacter sp. 15-1451]RAX58386.1 hypothetical protein CCZ01_02930 [Helicobacter sp. 15-1451]
MSVALPKIVFIGGKGGVGKSTLASAFATFTASQNKKTLLVSTDPAHNLKDIFTFKPSPTAIQIDKNLFILEIDPFKEVQEYVDSVATATKSFITAKSYHMMDSYYENIKESGVAQESALFDRLIRIITQEEWGQIVIDTAPTGHTLRLFALPKVLRSWSQTLLSEQEKSSHLEGIVGHIEGKNILKDRIEERYLIYTKFFNQLHNPQECGIIFVLNPEFLPIQETQRAVESLKKENLKPYAIIVNKIPPPSQDSFFQERFEMSEKYLQQIEQQFQSFLLIKIPLKPYDILHKQGLNEIVKEILFQLES